MMVVVLLLQDLLVEVVITSMLLDLHMMMLIHLQYLENGGLGDLTSTINSMTGLTVNGNIDVIGDINVTGTTFYTNITGTSIGVDYIDF